jgi:O-antigen chain-terminating methyltransferase
MTNDINVAETLAEIRGRVTARLSRTVPEIPELALPPLDPLRQARGVAEGWAGAIGVVNPRPPGLLNGLLQGGKQVLGRALRWFAFPQTQFNSGTIAALVRTEEMFADVNRNMVVLGQNLVDRQRKDAELERRIEESEATVQGVAQTSELVMQMLRGQIDEQAARLDGFERRQREISAGLSRSLEEMSRSVSVSFEQMHQSIGVAFGEVHGDVGRVEDHVNLIQERVWKDFVEVRQEIEAEMRLVRQRLMTAGTSAAPLGAGPSTTVQLPAFDYPHFEQRFRGKEEEIRRRQSFYLPMLRETLRETVRDNAPVLDVACGRGEMLELLREQGIDARGVDLDADMVARCHTKQLQVERADALAYLENCPEASLGAVFSAQFVEHLPAEAYSRLIDLSYSRLRAGGRLILETQNPECLAIYSQSFYLDPTHRRPVPAQQLRFLLEEAGFHDIQIHYLSPVERAGLPELPMQAGNEAWNTAAAKFNETYFGHMDYGITGVKPDVESI